MGENHENMETLLKRQNLVPGGLNRGDIIEGKVLAVLDKEALIDVGAKAEGILPLSEVKDQGIETGQILLVYVLNPEDRDGQIRLSYRRAQAMQVWLKLQKALETNGTLEVEVMGHNKGGLLVDVNGVQGFIPFSHLDSTPDTSLPQPEFQSCLDKMRGEKLLVKLIELDQEKNRVIFSEREAQEEERMREQRKVLERFSIGETIEASIKHVMPYGLVLDLTDVENLIPLDEITWEKEVLLASFARGQRIKAQIVDIDWVLGRITLSIKRLSSDPFGTVTQSFRTGDKIKGVVKKITSRGILMELALDVEGVLPLSALPEGKKEIKLGEEMEVIVEMIDSEKREIRLGV